MDHDPSKAARDARKERVAKNERQHKQNVARATQSTGPSTGPSAAPVPNSIRKKEIDRTLAVTRASTASMGKFDRKLEGEKKLKGLKRKVCRRSVVEGDFAGADYTLQFEPTEMAAANEKSNNMAILAKLDKEPTVKKSRKSESSGSDVLNVRKAIRSASKGKGSAALARDSGGKGKKGKR